MQFGLLVVVVILSLMDLAGSNKAVTGRRQKRRSTEVIPSCAKGCVSCSESNGCVKCSPKLFLHLERNDIRQTGTCLPSCPIGYYGVRNPDMNKCMKCKIENCEACFSKGFCTKCKEGLYLHKGRCYSTCPENFDAVNGTTECSIPAQCEMSEWGAWGPCSKKNKLCGFKKGTEERSRRILQAPSGETTVCPNTTESRGCTVKKKQCPGDKAQARKGRKDDQAKKENRNRNRNNKEKEGKKKRRGKQRGTAAPTTALNPSQ
ncbi:R-spondin-1 [Ambystoma mexicanum]|uniref:R-spondin-1 n=1 Tax=Ambystoma mexicanum TaxID=8296 RepID=UPI0037E98DC9